MKVVPLDDLATRVSRAPALAGVTTVAAIDGPAGAGKSTLATRLALRLDAPTVHMDDLYPGWDGLAEAVPRLVEWVLEPLARTRPARYRRYDWDRGAYAEWVDVPSSATLVVEGCASGSRAVTPYVSFLVWVDAPERVRRRRGIERDGQAFAPHWQRWARQEQALFEVERTRERADVIVDGDPRTAHDPQREVAVTRWPSLLSD